MANIIIFEIYSKNGSLDELMLLAIQNGNIEFVKLFIENGGCRISEFLTYRHLIKLYNKIPANSILYALLMRNKRTKHKGQKSNDSVFELREIGEILSFLISPNFLHQFLKKPLNSITLEQTEYVINEQVTFEYF
jgi:hypothetical protein